MSPVPDVLSSTVDRRLGEPWQSQNQIAMFAPLTRVKRPHHLARGLDQAKEFDRVRNCILMGRIRVSPNRHLIVVIVSQMCSGELRARGD